MCSLLTQINDVSSMLTPNGVVAVLVAKNTGIFVILFFDAEFICLGSTLLLACDSALSFEA